MFFRPNGYLGDRMYERAYHITMLTVALLLAVMGRGNSCILWEKSRDLEPLQIVLSGESVNALQNYVVGKIQHEIEAPIEVHELAISASWESAIRLQCRPMAAAPVCRSSARASPALG